VERCQELALEGVPEAKLGRHVATEVAEEGLAVVSLRRRREADQLVRLQDRYDRLIGGRRQVMALVDDDVLEVLGAEAVEKTPGPLDAREDVLVPHRRRAADHQLAERSVVQRVAKGVTGSLEDLLAVGEEEEPWRRADGGRPPG